MSTAATLNKLHDGEKKQKKGKVELMFPFCESDYGKINRCRCSDQAANDKPISNKVFMRDARYIQFLSTGVKVFEDQQKY